MTHYLQKMDPNQIDSKLMDSSDFEAYLNYTTKILKLLFIFKLRNNVTYYYCYCWYSNYLV